MHLKLTRLDTKMLTRRGVEFDKSDKSIREKIRKELVVAPVTLEQRFPKTFKTFLETSDAFVVPRFWATGRFDVRDVRSPGVDMTCSATFVGTLRAALKQPAAADAILKSFDTHGGGVVSLPTGHGKTSLAIWIATRLRKKTLVLVHKNFLADQFRERIAQHVPDAKVTRIQGDDFDTSGDFVIAMIQTLVARQYSIDAFEPFGLLIVDECHHVPAESFCRTMFGLAFPKVLGLSATPCRKDGLTRVMHWFLGPIAFCHSRIGQDNVTVNVRHYMHESYKDPPPLNKVGDIDYTGIITKLVDLVDRTNFIAEETKRLVLEGRRVLVLSHRRKHATSIKDALVACGVDAATYLGGDKHAPECTVTCATYSLASEGYDDPRLNALVLATPSSDVNQACGRILRGTGHASPVIVDVVDKYSFLYSQFVKRRRFYKATGFVIDGHETVSTPKAQECMFVDE